jgi:hypothetical protein
VQHGVHLIWDYLIRVGKRARRDKPGFAIGAIVRLNARSINSSACSEVRFSHRKR